MLNVLLVECEVANTALENALHCVCTNLLKTEHNPFFVKLVKEIRPDLIIINLDTPSESLLADLLELNQQLPIPVIVFADDSNIETVNRIIKAEVSSFVVNGLDIHRLNSILQVAIARFEHLQKLKHELEEARIQLEDRKQIDRAKAILINARNFTENEAYHTLRKLAMDRNITLGEMARNVIAMSELLK